MKKVGNIVRIVTDYAFWMMIAIGTVNICWSFLMVASNQSPKEVFKVFEIVAFVSSILLGILIVRMTKREDYLGCAEDIAGNTLSGILAFVSTIISLAWLNSF
ncbi:hypothetical protein HYV70_05085 [Candidatus Uhrbacteria bacterium]|nr:hypothetical protein [Candidatus Uhrbacteria bacterium]